MQHPRLLLRNHEALAALEAAVTKGPQAAPKRKGRWAHKNASPSPAAPEAPAADGADAAAAAANNGDASAGGSSAGAAAAAAASGGGAEGADPAAAAAAAGGEGSAEGAATPAAPGDQPVVAQGNTWRRLLNLIMQLRKVGRTGPSLSSCILAGLDSTPP